MCGIKIDRLKFYKGIVLNHNGYKNRNNYKTPLADLIGKRSF